MIADKRAKYPVKISGIKIHPEPIEGGKPAQFKILATAGKITGSIFFLHFYLSSHVVEILFMIVASILHFYNILLGHVCYVTHSLPWI